MDRIVECVPNFSEGRNQTTVQALIDAVTSTAHVVLLDHSMDPDHHRSVLTFCGTPDGVVEAAFHTIQIATDRIDLRQHGGVHPRVGATDVVPFIPIKGTTMQDCIQLAKQLGGRVGRELEIPVFLYERAANHPNHAPLETVRRGGLEGLAFRMASDPDWTPDFGPPRLHASAGAIVIGARPPLIAYNVNLRTTDLDHARSIARTVRQSNGGLRQVKAIGVELASRGMVQVAMNVTDYQTTPLITVFQAVAAEAAKKGVEIAGSEVIGLVPQAALNQTVATTLQLECFDPSQILETRLAEALSAQQEPNPTLLSFLSAVAAPTPSPAGGSVAALVGALAASLGVMGARLSHQRDIEQTLLQLGQRLHQLVQEDANAYAGLAQAYKLPKDRSDRSEAISKALTTATDIPLGIAELASEAGQAIAIPLDLVKPAVRSDLLVGIRMAVAATEAALSTAKHNLTSQINQSVTDTYQERMAKISSSLAELKRLC